MEGFIIEEELKKLPDRPGVYIMHKADREVIYVGKAKNLKNRVRQYFLDSYKKTNKIAQMVANIDYFEYIVVDNELESLILESNFIKEYRPRYNTLLKDDKNYPYIKITTNEYYPRVLFSHRKNKDKARYFGPYKSAGIVNDVLDFIKKTYKLRNCKLNIDENDIIDYFEDIKDLNENNITLVDNTSKNKNKKECLYYHIDMCLAPCIKNVKKEYDEMVKEVIDFLNGGYENTIVKLKTKMQKASDSQEYEKAIEYRDQINSINELRERQKIEQKSDDDKDIIGMFKGTKTASMQIFEVRDGKIIDRNVHFMNIDENDTEVDILESFIKQYYNEPYFMPSEIWLPIELKDRDLIEQWLQRDNKKIKIVIPKIGQNDKLVKLANMNAKIQYDQRARKYEKEKDDLKVAYDDLKKITGLDEINRLESYDISNTAGSINVASMVVFQDGNFKKNEYRKFRIKTVDGPDDYASMREVITRRLERYKTDDNKFNNLPSIFLIDGGAGQVNVVKEVLYEYKIDIPVIGMVKDDRHRTRGIIYNDVEADLYDFKELFKLITRIQDETHRFAIEYHKSLRSKEQIHSVLDDIDFIGDKRKISLIKHFENIENIRSATIEELMEVPGFTKKSASSVYEFFHSNNL